MDDHGELFALAVIVFVCSAVVLIMHRDELPLVGRQASSVIMAKR